MEAETSLGKMLELGLAKNDHLQCFNAQLREVLKALYLRRPRIAVSLGTIKAETSSVTVHTTSHEFPIITGPPLPYRQQIMVGT